MKLRNLPPIIFTLKLTSLELCDNRLKDIPAELAKIDTLTFLNLQANRLEGPLNENIINCTSLTSLGFHGNSITKLPDSLGKLINLQTLTLSCNELESIPDTIGNLTNLTELSLSSNHLKTIPSSIGQLTKLTSCVLDHNDLSSLPPEMGNLVNLPDFFCFSNHIQALPREMANLTKLTMLNLSKNNLKFIPFKMAKITRIVGKGNSWASEESTTRHGDKIIALKELCARIILSNHLVITTLNLHVDLEKYLKTFRSCDFCNGPYFTHHVEKVVLQVTKKRMKKNLQ